MTNAYGRLGHEWGTTGVRLAGVITRRGVSAFALLQRAGNLRAIRSDELERWLLAEGFAVRCDGTPRLVPTPLGVELGGCIDRLESSRRDGAYSGPMRVRANPAVSEILQEDGELDAILSGRGLSFERASGPPPTPPGPPLEIEPAPWHGQVGPPPASEPATSAESIGQEALAELRARDDTDDLPPRFGPVVQDPPLTRPMFPRPDWRQEELERARRDEPALAEEEPTNHPPPRRLPT